MKLSRLLATPKVTLRMGPSRSECGAGASSVCVGCTEPMPGKAKPGLTSDLSDLSLLCRRFTASLGRRFDPVRLHLGQQFAYHFLALLGLVLSLLARLPLLLDQALRLLAELLFLLGQALCLLALCGQLD